MEFLMAVRTLIATTVMLFCSLWLARQLKIHRPRLPVSAVLILSLIMLFEPGMLAFLVWVVHDIASVNGGLMIHAYTFVKASVAIYLLFILQSDRGWNCRSYCSRNGTGSLPEIPSFCDPADTDIPDIYCILPLFSGCTGRLP